jgi:hypothetical protein
MVCSVELPLAAPSLSLQAGAHDITAVLRRRGSAMFVASSAILIRPAPPIQQQQQQLAVFAAPLYRSDVPPQPLVLVPHVRVRATVSAAAAAADGGGTSDSKFIDDSGGDANDAAHALLQGDPISGGGMKVLAHDCAL